MNVKLAKEEGGGGISCCCSVMASDMGKRSPNVESCICTMYSAPSKPFITFSLVCSMSWFDFVNLNEQQNSLLPLICYVKVGKYLL